MREFTLELFFADKHSEMEYVQRWIFTLQPTIHVTRIEVVDDEGKKMFNFDETKIDQKGVEERIRQWIFKVDNTFNDFGVEVWRVSPKFNEEDKKQIKRLHLFEEL